MTELSQLQQSNKSLRQELDNVVIHNKKELQNLQIGKVLLFVFIYVFYIQCKP